MAESLHRSPGAITTWLTGYTPIQNVFGVKRKRAAHVIFTLSFVDVVYHTG